jgi:hypothetical protein
MRLQQDTACLSDDKESTRSIDGQSGGGRVDLKIWGDSEPEPNDLRMRLRILASEAELRIGGGMDLIDRIALGDHVSDGVKQAHPRRGIHRSPGAFRNSGYFPAIDFVDSAI